MSVSIESRIAIADGVHAFYKLIDSGKAAATAHLFAPDAKITFGPGSPKPGTLEGRAAIEAAMIAREAQISAFTRHVVSNLTYQSADDMVDVHYLLTLYRSDDESRDSKPAFVADVEEQWQAANGHWLIADRTILPAFARS